MSQVTPPEAPAHDPGERSEVAGRRELAKLVDAWVRDGIITAGQAGRIRARERLAPGLGSDGVRRRPLAFGVEIAGYLGGLIVVVAAMLLGSLYWSRLGDSIRLTIVSAAALALIGAGWAVPVRSASAGRLRAVLWLAGTVAMAGAWQILGSQLLGLDGTDRSLFAAAGTAAVAAALWLAGRGLLQQLLTMTASAVTAAMLVAEFTERDAVPGLAVWVVGAAWFAVSTGGRAAHVAVVQVFAAAVSVVGSFATMSADAGLVFALATAAAVIVLAARWHQLALFMVGGAGALISLPFAMSRWFPDSLAAAAALLGLGIALVLLALWVARRRAGAIE